MSGDVRAERRACIRREGLSRTRRLPRRALTHSVVSRFWRLAQSYWRTVAVERWGKLSKRAFVTALQRLIQEVTAADLVLAPSGVREPSPSSN